LLIIIKLVTTYLRPVSSSHLDGRPGCCTRLNAAMYVVGRVPFKVLFHQFFFFAYPFCFSFVNSYYTLSHI
jgi:hypothetical protein